MICTAEKRGLSENEFCLLELISAPKNIQNALAQVWSTTFHSFCQGTYLYSRRLWNSPQSYFLELFYSPSSSSASNSLHSDHVWFVLPCYTLFPQSLNLTSAALNGFSLNGGPRGRSTIQWHLRKDRRGCDPVTSPKTQTELPPPMRDTC